MIDTMGIFWTMKYPNLKDEDLLEEWGLPKNHLIYRYIHQQDIMKSINKREYLLIMLSQ